MLKKCFSLFLFIIVFFSYASADYMYENDDGEEVYADYEVPFKYQTSDCLELRYGIMFGMSKKDIINAEPTSPIKRKSNYILFNDDVAGKDAYIAYYFSDDSLHQVSIYFLGEYDKGNSYFDDFYSIDSSLIDKYGDPIVRNEMTWDNDKYKDNRSDYGKALLQDHCKIDSVWINSARTIIILHNLEYKNDFVVHSIDFLLITDSSFTVPSDL